MLRFTKSDPRFYAIRFVLRARECDKNKPVFAGLYSDGGNIVGSDERRLHLSPVDIQAGLYEVIKDTASEVILGEQIDGQYVSYKKAFPNLDGVEPIELGYWTKIYNAGASKAFFQIAAAGVCVNYSYLAEAIRDAEKPLAQITGAESPVVITHNLGTALIMPIRQD